MSKFMKRIGVVAVLIFLVAGFFAVRFYFDSPNLGDAASYDSLEVETIDRVLPRDEWTTITTTSEPEMIAAIVATLNSGERILDCRCLWTGFVRLHSRVGGTTELQLVPGHEPDRFDIRLDGKRYSVDKSALAAAIEAMGGELIGHKKPNLDK